MRFTYLRLTVALAISALALSAYGQSAKECPAPLLGLLAMCAEAIAPLERLDCFDKVAMVYVRE